jgi:hypothetical protein
LDLKKDEEVSLGYFITRNGAQVGEGGYHFFLDFGRWKVRVSARTVPILRMCVVSLSRSRQIASITLIKPWPLPSKSFTAYCSSAILIFDAE